jgi:hypothetical protein
MTVNEQHQASKERLKEGSVIKYQVRIQTLTQIHTHMYA